MGKNMELKGKKVIVAGSGVSGIGAVRLLDQIGAEIVLYDGNENLTKEEVKAKLPKGCSVEIQLGELTEKMLKGISIMIVSPGIAIDAPCVETARKAGLMIWGEIELAYQFSKGKLIAITGTNGKTTTTALTGEIMKTYYDSVFVVGNIGTPYTSVANQTKDQTITVAEISSFQLETIWEFAPQITAILNITPDHLNRHKTMENYIAVKESITKNQTSEGICVLNYEDKILREFGASVHTKTIFFSSKRKLARGLYLEGEEIMYQTETELLPVIKVSEMNLVGMHNVENVMAATAIAYAMGVPMECIRKTIQNFHAVEHRVEFVCQKDGIIYYNDSKGTNPEASIQAIRAMNRPTILIGGGYDKKSEFDIYVEEFKDKVKLLVLIGATKDKIAETARRHGFDQILFAASLKDAVKLCREHAISGDAVLLSPACASWDMFESYEQRGTLFKEYVKAL